jgi:hypothetical protein
MDRTPILQLYGEAIRHHAFELVELDPDDKDEMNDLFEALGVRTLAEKSQMKKAIRNLRKPSMPRSVKDETR